MQILQNKKMRIVLGSTLVVILIGISIIFFTRKEEPKEEKDHIKKEYKMLVEIIPSVKLT